MINMYLTQQNSTVSDNSQPDLSILLSALWEIAVFLPSQRADYVARER